jgi:hypothetical protein
LERQLGETLRRGLSLIGVEIMAIIQTAVGPVSTPEYVGAKKAERYTLSPTIPSNPTVGSGAGSGSPTATLSPGSSDYSGQVTVVTGSAPAVTQTIFTFNLANPADSTNYRVNITPGNALAAELAATAQPNTASIGLNSWVLQSGAAALAASGQTYVWNYTLDDITTSVVITPAGIRSIDAVEAYGPMLDRVIFRGSPDTVQVKMRPHGITAEVVVLGR